MPESRPTTSSLAAPEAAPPYPPPRRSVVDATRQYAGLVRVLLAEYRSTWFFHAFFSLLLPVGLVYFFTTLSSDIGRDRAIYLVGSNLATSIAFGPASMTITKIGWGRHNREFDYWAALPVPKVALVLALVSVALLFAIPGVAGTYVVGCLLLGLPLGGGLAFVPLVPLAALSLAGFGAFLGTYAKDGPTAGILANLLIGFVTFLSPMAVPAAELPAPLRLIAPLAPTTHAADAFRAALGGRLGPAFATDTVLLAVFAVAFLWLVHHRLDWRAA